jgi:hypothetical protein
MKWLKRILIAIAALAAVFGLFLLIIHEKRPSGESGPEADAVARKIQAAVGTDKWSEVGAILFTYGGRHTVLWDRARSLVRVDWGTHRAMYRLSDMTGRAFHKDVEITDPEKKKKILEEGHRWFINDTFWLNPFMSFFDEGVTRAIVPNEENMKMLLISYASGGVTPGDSYLWMVGADAVPRAWKMWVTVIPVGGLEVSWDEWEELPGGAKVSMAHNIAGLTIRVTDLKAGKTLSEVVPGEDPFAAIID